MTKTMIEITAPDMTFETLLSAVSNTSFDCGEHDRSEDEPYDVVYARSVAAKSALRMYVTRLATSQLKSDATAHIESMVRAILAECTTKCLNCDGTGYVSDRDDEDNCHFCNRGYAPALSNPWIVEQLDELTRGLAGDASSKVSSSDL